ncbi:DUF721 domain-containing protein [Burkholderia glumae]|uniref:DUF721 domain-containing protein n=1 Tax=Burkholderia glumae TaxID=337 RepID=UPI0005C28FEF|nr:DUF721 domain-containing protein [Burkholderia glumae]MCM2491967.1 DUF721 domain-containing protein [Burkholderia glumae]MCM2542964.1 DUF721 domain-containing protein [Burkholderia glumae]MCM2549746.1 DUF721 domain-containing protein [Burkholderia glumae]MCQ0031090.1 DUF721 domain-containing protein [Burkholderia glumae]MCQ0034830.1 DUF721 domain-containing protein [Burkholderia glumae]
MNRPPRSAKPSAHASAHASGYSRPQVAAEVLKRTDAFAALRAGVEQVASLQRDLRALLPDYLASHVEPGSIKDGGLTLFAAHNALAARLRQVAPRLVADLQARGWHVATLKVRVRPQDAPEPLRIKQARMTPAGAEALRELAQALAPSPLRNALARMADRHTKKTKPAP